MDHYLDYMDEIYENKKTSIHQEHPDWKINRNFTIYVDIKPIAEGMKFQTTLQLKKQDRTSVILVQEFDGKKAKQYFSEFDIIHTFIYIFDTFKDEGNYIYHKMIELIKDNGNDVSFIIDEKQFSFKGINYLSEDKLFKTFADYIISINDFISLLNLVIEKDRYSKESKDGKSTILKYILFLLLISNRSEQKIKMQMKDILEIKSIYIDDKLSVYKNIINRNGKDKIYFDSILFKDIL